MTLRLELSIIPFGDEDGKRIIKTINISNLGSVDDNGICLYGVEVDKYKTRKYDCTVTHKRSDGAETLVRKLLQDLGY